MTAVKYSWLSGRFAKVRNFIFLNWTTYEKNDRKFWLASGRRWKTV